MGGSYLTDALLFLVNTIFSIYILLVVLRFLLQLVRADSRNPVSQFLLSAPARAAPVAPLHPGFAGSIVGIVLRLALRPSNCPQQPLS